MKIIKNIPHADPVTLKDEVGYLTGQIVSKTLSQNAYHSLTLFAFDKDEEISTHSSDGDAMVLALEGEGRITIDGTDYTLKAGECIVMPAKVPHAVYAQQQFKMMLTVLFQ